MDLKGKACVVTGGARNLGKAIAKNLLERGAKVSIGQKVQVYHVIK